MRALDYAITTVAALFLAYVVATPVAKFIDQSFKEAARNLEQMNGG